MTRKSLLLGLFHLLCLSVYMIPILTHTFSTQQQQHKHEINRVAVLDESHIMSESNRDINGEGVSLETIFTNDYWGRPMNSPSSHKSWRPLTVLQRLLLRNNNLSGPLPTHLPYTLIHFNVDRNQFHGPIPTQWQELVWMERLILSDNLLEGQLVTSLCFMMQL